MTKNNNFTTPALVKLSDQLAANLNDWDAAHDLGHELINLFWEQHLKIEGVSFLNFEAFIFMYHVKDSDINNLIEAADSLQSNGFFEGVSFEQLLKFLKESNLTSLLSDINEKIQEIIAIEKLTSRCVEFFQEANKITGVELYGNEDLTLYEIDAKYIDVRDELVAQCEEIGVDFYQISRDVAREYLNKMYAQFNNKIT